MWYIEKNKNKKIQRSEFHSRPHLMWGEHISFSFIILSWSCLGKPFLCLRLTQKALQLSSIANLNELTKVACQIFYIC